MVVRKAKRGEVIIDEGFCTGCGYCWDLDCPFGVCPHGVAISSIFQIYNEALMYDDLATGRFRYRGTGGLEEEERADQCTECGECLEKCPQEIDIPEWLQKVHTVLEPTE